MQLSDILDQGNQLKVLNPSGGCNSCPLGRKNFVPSTLRDTKLLIVGEAPGATEVETGEGFTGQSGTILRNYLEKHGITEFSLTNTVHCRPPDNRNPHAKEKRCCLNQFVLDEVKGYDVVLLAGNVPADNLFPHSSAAKLRGHVAWHPDFPGQRFYTIYHPAFIARRPDKTIEFDAQIEKLAWVLEEDGSAPWDIIRGDTRKSLETLQDILNTGLYSFDIETSGLESWHHDKTLESFALCSNEEETVFFHKNDPYWEEAIKYLTESFEDSDTMVVAHNVGFDLEWLERQYDANIRCQFIDTQYLYYLLYMEEDFRKARMPSLKKLSIQELDGYRFLVPQPHMCTDEELLGKYNTEDIVLTLKLFKKGFPQLTEKQRDLLLKIGSPSSLATRRLETTGLHVDLDYCEDLYNKLTEDRENEIRLWKEEDPKFNPEEHISGDSFIDYVYEINDLPVVKRTEKDQKPATDKYTIRELIDDHGANFLEHRLELQTIDKQRSTYVEPYRSGKLIDSFTGRVHPSYLNTFTRTARLSSRDPNAQNYSRNDTVKHSVRKLISAPEGKIFMQSDLSQIELRIAMSLAGDETGIEAYWNQGDLHARTAGQLANRAGRDDWKKEDRTNAKIMNFSLTYSGDEYTVKRYAKETFGIDYSWDEAKEFHKAFFATYEALGPWHKNIIKKLRQNKGVIETAVGFKRFFYGWDSSDQGTREHYERKAINTTCQNPAGLMTLYILFLVQQEIRKQKLDREGVLVTGSVHDSILYESPEEYFYDVVNIVEDATQKVYKWAQPWFKVPLVMDYEKGPSWGELEEVDIDHDI